MTFALDARLAEDTVAVGQLRLSTVRLHRDARYPWVVLIPRRAGAREIHGLASEDRATLIQEIAAIANAMERALDADKMNVAALGNMVPQLHVHVVARYLGDDAWPGAIWGAHPPLVYEAHSLRERLALLRESFEAVDGFIAAE